jgi:excisionase family DNA binding protein
MNDSSADVRFLTPAEVADRLKVSAVTVRRWANEGRVPSYRLGPKGTSVRFDPVELERWLREPEGDAA